MVAARFGGVAIVRSWRTLLGIVISAGFLFFAFRGQDIGRVRDAIQSFNLWYIIPALCLYFTGIFVRSFRWSVLLRPVTKTNARELLPVTVVGFMANNVLPLRTGEVVRAYVLSKRYNVKKTSALATIAVERLFDGLTMLGFMLVAATAVTLHQRAPASGADRVHLVCRCVDRTLPLDGRRQPARPAPAGRARSDAAANGRPRRARWPSRF